MWTKNGKDLRGVKGIVLGGRYVAFVLFSFLILVKSLYCNDDFYLNDHSKEDDIQSYGHKVPVGETFLWVPNEELKTSNLPPIVEANQKNEGESKKSIAPLKEYVEEEIKGIDCEQGILKGSLKMLAALSFWENTETFDDQIRQVLNQIESNWNGKKKTDISDM